MRRLFVLACVLLATLCAVTTPASAAQTRSTVLVVDTSGSMNEAKVRSVRSAVSAYLSALPRDVEVGIVAFSTDSELVLTPTRDRSAVELRLAALRSGGSTSLYDAVLMARRVASAAGASRIVVLTDGADSSSQATLDSTVRRLAGSAIPLDAVDVRPGKQPGAGLRRLAEATGGTVVTAGSAEQLAASMSALPKVSDQPAAEPSSDGWSMTRWLQVALALCFVGFVSLLGSLFVRFGGTSRSRGRAQAIVGSYGASAASMATPDGSLYDRSPVMRSALSVANRVAASPRVGSPIVVLLTRAGLGLKPPEWLLVMFGVSAGLGSVLGLLVGNLVVGLLLGAVIGAGGCHGWLVMKAARRARAFDERLPDALQLLASGLASGFAFSQAVDSVARRGPEPVAEEFGRALAESRLGAELTDALDRVAVRMASRDLQLTVMSIRIQREVGGNLAEVLRGTVHTMRERAYLRRQVRTLSAEGRLSAYILIALPIGIAGLLQLTRGEYLQPLYTDPLGMLLVAGAVVATLIGAFVMRKMVKVEV